MVVRAALGSDAVSFNFVTSYVWPRQQGEKVLKVSLFLWRLCCKPGLVPIISIRDNWGSDLPRTPLNRALEP